jgi:hypothetical protein
MERCIICDLVEPIEKVAEEYSKALFDAISPLALNVFSLLVTLWVLYIIFKALTGELALAKTIKQILIFVAIISMLQNETYMWDLFTEPLESFVEGMIELIIDVSSTDYYYIGSQKGYMSIIDWIMQEIYSLGSSIVSTWNPIHILSGMIVIIIYGWVAIMAVYSIIEYMYLVFIISAFSPLFLVACGFTSTRGCAVKALQCILTSVLALCFSIFGMSFTVVIYNELISDVQSNNSILEVSKWAWGSHWLSLVCLGAISVLQQQKSRVLASNLIGMSNGYTNPNMNFKVNSLKTFKNLANQHMRVNSYHSRSESK